jgi:hypothetical protein
LQLLFRVGCPRLDPVRLYEIVEQVALVYVLFLDEAEFPRIKQGLGEEAIEAEANPLIPEVFGRVTLGWRIAPLHTDDG